MSIVIIYPTEYDRIDADLRRVRVEIVQTHILAQALEKRLAELPEIPRTKRISVRDLKDRTNVYQRIAKDEQRELRLLKRDQEDVS